MYINNRFIPQVKLTLHVPSRELDTKTEFKSHDEVNRPVTEAVCAVKQLSTELQLSLSIVSSKLSNHIIVNYNSVCHAFFIARCRYMEVKIDGGY